MDETSVDEAVTVTTPLYGRDPRVTEYTVRAIEAHPDRPWGVGLCEYFGDDECLPRVEKAEFLSAQDLSYLPGCAFESVHGVRRAPDPVVIRSVGRRFLFTPVDVPRGGVPAPCDTLSDKIN
jgi:hypothetical protein